MTHPAQRISVGISTSGLDPHPPMQEEMIGPVLTDHERRRIRLRAIGMMHFSEWRQLVTESDFGAQLMQPYRFAVSVQTSICSCFLKTMVLSATRARTEFNKARWPTILMRWFECDAALLADTYLVVRPRSSIANSAGLRAETAAHHSFKRHSAILADSCNLCSSHAGCAPHAVLCGQVRTGVDRARPNRLYSTSFSSQNDTQKGAA